MGLIQASRPPGSGGGGSQITGWENENFTNTAPFVASSWTFNLAQTPLFPKSLLLKYNNANLRYGIDYSLAGNTVTVLFGDPYTYENDVVIEANYPY